jgi:hypothetical protein
MIGGAGQALSVADEQAEAAVNRRAVAAGEFV